MPKVKYYYDSDTLSYKKIKTTKRTVLKYVSVYLLGSALFGFLFILIVSKYFESPKEKSLTRELQNLQMQFEVLNKKIDIAVSRYPKEWTLWAARERQGYGYECADQQGDPHQFASGH